MAIRPGQRRRMTWFLGAVALAAAMFALFWYVQGVRAGEPTQNTVAVDADAGTTGIQASVTKNVGETFTVAHVITQSPDAWSAEQTNMKYDPNVLEYVPESLVNMMLGGTVLCGGVSTGGGLGPDYLYEGCTRLSGTTTATGVTRTYMMRCIKGGTSPLHLQTAAEVGGDAIATNFALAGGTVGDPILVDASVTCVGGELPRSPTPTPTNTPTRTPTNTPTATNTPCVVNGVACTPTPTLTPSPTRTRTATPQNSPTPIPSSTPTATRTAPAATPTRTPVSQVSPVVGTPTRAPVGGVPPGRPPLPPSGTGMVETRTTTLLWLGPAVFAVVGLGGAAYLRTRKRW